MWMGTEKRSALMPAGRLFRKSYFWLGLGLLAAFCVQQILRWQWLWLAEWQNDAVYMQLSGLLLVLFLEHQWRCSVLRCSGRQTAADKLLSRHKWVGALAPLFLCAHAQSIGHAYLQALSWTFLALVLTGLFNGEILHIRKAWFRTLWLLLHIGLATVLLFLLGYHVVISYAYE